MIRIFTSTKEEYGFMKKFVEENKDDLMFTYVDLKKPQDSIASVVWSIEDARSYFPEGTPDEVIENGLCKIEKTIKEDMTARGYETIDILQDVLTEDIED